MYTIKILIADDHQIIRDGIRALVKDAPDIEIVGEAENGRHAIEMLQTRHVDMVIMDVNMPEMNGIDATTQIAKLYPNIPVLCLSMHDEVEYISKMLQAGAAGYILKNSGKQELLNAIHKIRAGEKYFSSDVSYAMLMTYIGGMNQPGQVHQRGGSKGTVQLTKRELEIIKLISGEMTNQEIADKLSISLRTVDTHRRNLLQKLGVKNTAGLVRYAIQQNLID